MPLDRLFFVFRAPLASYVARPRRSWTDFGHPGPAIERLEDRALLAGIWSDGIPAAGVSATPEVPQDDPAVAVGPDGRYVVAWANDGAIAFRRFHPDGTPLDAENRSFGINPHMFTFYTNLRAPSVGMAANGDFVIAFEAEKHIAFDMVGTVVGFARFAADGTMLGSPELIGVSGSENYAPSVAVADDGRFVIAWTQEDSAGNADAVLQIFTATGDPLSPPHVFANSADDEIIQDVAINPVNGDFVVVWAHQTADGSGTISDLYQVVFRPDGSVRRGVGRVIETAAGRQFDAAVAMDARSEIVFAWSDGDVVRLRVDDGDGTASEEVVYATAAAEHAVLDVDVATARDGSALVVGIAEDVGGTSNVLYRQYHDLVTDAVRTETAGSDADDISVAMNIRNDYVLASDAGGTTAAYHRFQPFDAIGVFRDGLWSLDYDYDGGYGHADTSFYFGQEGDLPVVGDWDGDGFDEVGVFRDGTFYLDRDGSRSFGSDDLVFAFGGAGDLPVVGDWDGDGRDQVGVFRDGVWSLDQNGDGAWGDGDAAFLFGTAGDIPVVLDSENVGLPSLAVFRDGVWSVDRDRDGAWNPAVDLAFTFGLAGDRPATGNWLGPDPTGDDNAAVFRSGIWSVDLDADDAFGSGDGSTTFGLAGDRPVAGRWARLVPGPTAVARSEAAAFHDGSWMLDANGDGVFGELDHVFAFGQPGDVPVAGDFDGDGFDEIGVFRDGTWYLDLNGNRTFDDGDLVRVVIQTPPPPRHLVTKMVPVFGLAGDQPVVGDWNGDGRDEIGVFRDGVWYLDLNRDFQWSGSAVDATFTFGQAGDTAVAGDWDGDSRDEVGVFRRGVWVLDYDGNRSAAAGDVEFAFGLDGDLPMVGDWNGDGRDEVGVARSGIRYLDKDGDFDFDALDRAFVFGLADALPAAGRWPIAV